MRLPWLIASLGALWIAAPSLPAEESRPADDGAKLEFFEKKIRPLLVDNCYNCHSANTNAKGGLRVDDHRGLVVGGGSGPAIVPGDAAKSLLIQAVKYDGLEMPPKKRLADEQIADLEKWIQDGAVWPKTEVSAEIGKPNEKYERLRKEHWAWQPLRAAAVPQPLHASWAKSDVDRFLLAKLEENGLSPVADADRRTLIRRLTFDLTGLPPTMEEVDAFLADASSQAVEKVVDRLLASQAYGERWGRHWLDVARYGESTGSSRNVPYPQAWKYRDYVIDAFNNDKPYDQFIREQIAGDLLPADSEAQRNEQLTATGFLALGVKDVNQRFKVRFVMDNIDEQIDTVTRSILAVTASCARCHDHKFDPVPTTDYYALAGIFSSTDLCAGVRNKMGGGGLDYYDTGALVKLNGEVATLDESKAAEIEKLKVAVAEAKKAFETLRDSAEGEEKAPNGKPKRQVARQKWNKLQQELNALTDPAASGQVVLGVREAKTVGDTELRVRGEAEKLGPVIPRGFLSLIAVTDAKPIDPATSGRRELADWLANSQNPLTSRVIVNRVWAHLFGRGLVSSVDNFGLHGDVPSHPELLDHLAAKFVTEGWSLKKLIRELTLTRAYQLSATATETHLAKDPQNHFIWRHTPRRLSAEELRDATLAASSRLNRERPEGSPANKLKVVEIRNNGAEAKQIHEAARASLARSVYLPLVRDLTPVSLEVFDFAEQGMVTGSRETTTVPTQALYLLNDPFVRREALAIAEKVVQAESAPEKRLQRVYRETLGREPTTAEVFRVAQFLSEFAAKAQPTLAAAEAAKTEVVAADQPAESTAKPTPVIDPDQVITNDVPLAEEVIRPSSADSAAWAALCQALIGSAEFRYVR